MPTLMHVDIHQLEELATQLRNGPQRLREASVRLLNSNLRKGVKVMTEIVTAGGDYRTQVEGQLHRRSGRLAQSLWYQPAVTTGTTITGALGTLKNPGGEIPAYFHAQEEGTGPIRPVRAKVLTIPLEASLFPTGVQRWTAREAAQHFARTFWKRVTSGALILFGASGKGKLTPLFVGVKETRGIRAIHYVQRGADSVVPLFRRDVKDWWATSLLAQTRSGGG